MQDDEIVHHLRASRQLCPVDLAVILDKLTDGGLSQGSFVTYFKRAFPSIPLGILLQAGGWQRLSEGGMTDEEFNGLIQPYIDHE